MRSFTSSYGLTVQKFRHLVVQKFERQKSSSLHFPALLSVLYDTKVQLDRKTKPKKPNFKGTGRIFDLFKILAFMCSFHTFTWTNRTKI